MQPLYHNSFEENAKQAAEVFAMAPSPKVLAGIQQRLHPEKKRRRVLFWWLAAPVVMGIISTLIFNAFDTRNTTVSKHKHSEFGEALHKGSKVRSLQHVEQSKINVVKASQPLQLVTLVKDNSSTIIAKFANKLGDSRTFEKESEGSSLKYATGSDSLQRFVKPALVDLTTTPMNDTAIVVNLSTKNELVLQDTTGTNSLSMEPKSTKSQSRKGWEHFTQIGVGAALSTITTDANIGVAPAGALTGGITSSLLSGVIQQKKLLSVQFGWQVMRPIHKNMVLSTGVNLEYNRLRQIFTSTGTSVVANPSTGGSYKGYVNEWNIQIPILLQVGWGTKHRYKLLPIAGIINQLNLAKQLSGYATATSSSNFQNMAVVGFGYQLGKSGSLAVPTLQYQWRSQPLFSNSTAAPSHHIIFLFPLKK